MPQLQESLGSYFLAAASGFEEEGDTEKPESHVYEKR